MDVRKFQDGDFDPRESVRAWLVPVMLVLLLLFGAYVALKSFYTVDPNEQAVVLRFGEYHATTLPGLHFCVPLVDEVLKVSIEEHTVRLPVGVGGKRPGSVSEEETLMLTGDLNAASVEWTVQWKVNEPKDYLFSFFKGGNPDYIEDVIKTVAQTVMNRLVGDYSIDEVLTTKRTDIAADARESSQGILDQYNCGVIITDLQMQRVTPPAKVKPAFDAVNSAIQERDRLENEAQKERNQLIPAAKADRDKKIREAEGYADRRRAEVNGEIAALRAKFDAYQEAPEITRERLYLESMQNVLEAVDMKIILDSDLRQVLPLLDLQQGSEK